MTAILIIIQVLFYALVINILTDYSTIIHAISYLFSVILSLIILNNKSGTLDIKLPWIVLILIFPVFGSLFYLLFERQRVLKKIRQGTEYQAYSTKKISYNNELMYFELKNTDKSAYNQSKYIFKTSNLPVYRNTRTHYFPSGETYFIKLIEELEKAEKFIFLEYFIIREGKMWNTILEILERKAKNNVEIRLMYDDLGCISYLPVSYKKVLEAKGIKCEVFNPITPLVTLAHNIRDHRKIVVIDGKIGFTGGINLSDEYINVTHRLGHWKDTGIMIEGDAVNSLSLMFLEMWHIYADKNEDNKKFIPDLKNMDNVVEIVPKKFKIQEYVQPYMSSPMDTEKIIARNVYINILNTASNYVYITTPYLILDEALTKAIMDAAKRSVDIRIITPGIPDKRLVYGVTRSQYYNLIKAGVSIYEYTPGFVHAKNVVSDDKIATIGSINFDNRSFYHSYECGIWIFNSRTVIDMKEDFLNIQSLSRKVYLDYIDKIPFGKKISIGFFRLLSPLL